MNEYVAFIFAPDTTGVVLGAAFTAVGSVAGVVLAGLVNKRANAPKQEADISSQTLHNMAEVNTAWQAFTKEVQGQVAALKEKVDHLEKENADLRKKLDELKREHANLLIENHRLLSALKKYQGEQ